MATPFDIQVNDRDVQVFLSGVGSGKARNLFLSSVRKGLSVLARQTTANFKANRRKGWKQRRVKVWNRKGEEKEKILHVAKTTTNRKEETVKVHIMSDYRVKWLEMGTKERRTKGRKIVGSYYKGKRKYLIRQGKGRRTGKVQPEWFFLKAQRQTKDQVEQKINQEMTKAIRKAAQGK